jgi:putative AdoMet-dependent methyltransferase
VKINDIATKLNITPRAIRFYEAKGLIAPLKQAHNRYRTFTEQDVWRLQTIIALREAGFSIEQIRTALPLLDVEDPDTLHFYLDMQRSALVSQWLELKQVIEMTGAMIDLLKRRNTLPIEDIYRLAEGSKRLREVRQTWSDEWNFDQRAAMHDEHVTHSCELYPDYEEVLTAVVDWVAAANGERGLDIGTGTGNLAGKFIASGITMSGVDQSKEMIKQCRRKYPQMELRMGNFLALPYVDGQFDFIVTSFALHHLTAEQKLVALGEMRRVLRPHGRMCIADRDLPSLQSAVPLLLRWFEDNDYIAKAKQLRDSLYLVYAVSIR